MYNFRRKNINRYNKFQFNFKNLSNLVVVESIHRYIIPMTEYRDVGISGKPGRMLMRNQLGSRQIRLGIRFIEDTYEQVQERVYELAPLLYSDKPQMLRLRDTDLYNIALLTESTEISKMIETGYGELVFTCFDPFSYGETKDFTLGASTFINNLGFEAVGVFLLTTSSVNQIKISLNNQRHIILYGPFANGGQLSINTEQEMVYLNGNLINSWIGYESDFFNIPSGESTIQLVGATGRLEIVERWL